MTDEPSEFGKGVDAIADALDKEVVKHLRLNDKYATQQLFAAMGKVAGKVLATVDVQICQHCSTRLAGIWVEAMMIGRMEEGTKLVEAGDYGDSDPDVAPDCEDLPPEKTVH